MHIPMEPADFRDAPAAGARGPTRFVLPVAGDGPFRPESCGRMAEDLEYAIARFAKWNLPIKEKGRLKRAVSVLRRVAERGRFGADPEQLQLIANAVMVAGDFSAVAYFLNDGEIQVVFEELVGAMGGSLAETGKQTAYDLQSQFWFSTILARAKLRVTAPHVEHGRRPDFVFTFEELEHSAEVKRPKTLHSAVALIESAADQIRQYGAPGIIVVDIAQCLNTRDFILSLLDRREEAIKLIDERFRAVTEELDRGVRYGDCDRYGHVVAMIAHCKYPYWCDRSNLTMRFAWRFGFPSYRRAYGGVLVDQTARLRVRFGRALHEFLGQPRWSGATPVPGRRAH
jgi:hypothetical protein